MGKKISSVYPKISSQYLKIKLGSNFNAEKKTSIYFKLLDIDIVNKYKWLVNESLKNKHYPCHVSWGMYVDKKYFKYLKGSINNSIQYFNRFNPDGRKFELSVNDEVGNETLNNIHNDYENLANYYFQFKRPKDTKLRWKKAFHQNIIKHLNNVNNCVHALESIIQINEADSNINGWFAYSLCAPIGDKIKIPLEEEDYDLFTMDEEFGDLFLGYATTGKNLYHIMKDNDIKLLDDGAKASPQRLFSANSLAIFSSYKKNHDKEMAEFNKWWDENDISDYGYTKNDRHNSIGYIKIGKYQPIPVNSHLNETETVDYYSEFSVIEDIELAESVQ